MLVDDSRLNLIHLQQTVTPWGYEITTAKDGLEAWKWLQDQDEPVLALVDWVMPAMDGIELCKRLQASDHRHLRYIIMLTVRGGKDEIALALDAGADDYITKPFHPRELQSRLQVGRRILENQYILEKMTEELIEANKKLERMVTIDGLTGIANRRHFDERYQEEWRRAMREGTSLAVIIADIDYFKRYNDAYGHLSGDECLRQVAATLASVISRGGDLIARFGGEEFAVLLPNTDSVGAVVVAESLRSAINRLAIEHQGSPLKTLTMSFGLVIGWPKLEEGPEKLLEKADKALYQAKESGRNNVHRVL